jgi:hypothetical protein
LVSKVFFLIYPLSSIQTNDELFLPGTRKVGCSPVTFTFGLSGLSLVNNLTHTVIKMTVKEDEIRGKLLSPSHR